MRIKKKLIRLISSVMLVLTIFASTCISDSLTLISEAASTYTLEEDFIPTRSWYPYFISVNSSCTSTLLKGIWERLIYEENNFSSTTNKGSYSSWSREYYTGTDVNYVGIGGTSVAWGSKTFSTDTGDFDAFLGNSMEANPDMLGEMLGLSGYNINIADSSKKSAAITTYQNILYKKMSAPETYTNFALSMVSLTANGKYLDGSLKAVSSNGKTFDYWMLCTLAYFYEGDGSETYLSAKQVTWLESYTSYLVSEYVSSGSTAFNTTSKKYVKAGSSLAGKYEPVYNLIARSSVGVNNASKNKEFFNYVVASGTGAGAWLNKHNSISIAGLSAVDDLAGMFSLSDGWCGGLDATGSCSSHDGVHCYNATNCKNKATAYDVICVYLHTFISKSKVLISNHYHHIQLHHL